MLVHFLFRLHLELFVLLAFFQAICRTHYACVSARIAKVQTDSVNRGTVVPDLVFPSGERPGVLLPDPQLPVQPGHQLQSVCGGVSL